MSTAIVWFRRDLRLADHAALVAACAAHARVLPLYVHAPDEEGEWSAGAASRWWLHHALAALDRSLRRRDGALHLRHGDSLTALRELLAQTGATAVYVHRQYEPAARSRDRRIAAALAEQGVAWHAFPASGWGDPWEVSTKQGEPYRVFTPFWRSLRAQLGTPSPQPVPAASRLFEASGGSSLASLALLPRIGWDAGLAAAWTPGEDGAQAQLELFLDDAAAHYALGRDLPARHGTSRLSPHLAFGEITPVQIQHALIQAARQGGRQRPEVEPFLRELGWREFGRHLLHHFPATPTRAFQPAFERMPWAQPDEATLQRWRHGRTGIPLVDAGMRELWHTGWMHNRVRMVVGSFLTKHLHLHWLHGARWFWDTLVDADLASNTLNWQWVAGTGADAAPYFRIFNPVTQSRKFDPDGVYLRRWLPELAAVGAVDLHEPWKVPGLLARSGYPAPMLDLAQERARALAAYQQMRAAAADPS